MTTKPDSSSNSNNGLTMNQRWLILLSLISVGLYWISLYLYVPTLPVYAQSKTTNLALVGTVLAQYGLWQALIRLPLGIFSDWLGRRKQLIMLGFVLAGLGAWIMGMSNQIGGLVVGRAITGLAAGSWVVMVVYFSSLFPPAQAVRATALLSLVNSVCRMFATGLTGTLNGLGGYSLAFYLAAIAAGAALVIYLPVKEEKLPSVKPSFQTTGRLITRRDVLLPAILNAVLQYAVWATTFGFLPILAKQVGASDVTQSLLVSMNIGVVTIGNLITTAIIHRVGTRRLTYIIFMLIGLGVFGAAFAHNLPMVFAAQFIIGLGAGAGYPLLMGLSIEHVDRPERSTAMGLHQAVYAIGMFGGPWLSGILADWWGLLPMFVFTGVITLVLGLWLTPKAV
jgi:DHA1 family multidrug resistance protein-like MFS transporter